MNPFTATTTAARASVVLIAGILLSLVAMVMPSIASAGTPATNQCQRSAKLVPSCGVLWGAYVPVGSGQTWTTAVTSLESQIGRNFDIVYHYHDFSGPSTTNGSIPDSFEKTLASSGHIIFDNWQSRVFSTGQQYTWANIAAGDYDSSVVIPTAMAIKAYGQPVMLSFDHEMDRYVGATGTAADYVAAYRHLHDVFAAQGVSNVVWVWTPTGSINHYSMFNGLYPGNAYVDWIGYDPYNFYNCANSSGTWQTPQQVLDPMYQWLESNGYGDKPFVLPEFGTMPSSSDSTAAANWFSTLPSAVAAHPNIKAMVEWDDVVNNCNSELIQPGEIAAYSQAGLSPQIIGTQAPVAPAAPSLSGATSTGATVSWAAVSGATSYQVQRSVSGANTFTNVGSPVSGITLQDTGLAPGASYDYRVVAANAAGSSAPSVIASVRLLPGQPGALNAVTNGVSEVDLSWSAAPGATSYDVRKGAVGAGAVTTDLGTVTATSFADTGLAPGATSDYEVVPVDAAGNGAPSSPTTGTTLPAHVTDLVATTPSTSEVDLNWNASTGATSYDIRKGAVGAGAFTTDLGTVTSTSFADTGLAPGASSDYEVVPVDAAGNGSPSTPATGTTLPGQVSGLSTTAMSPGEVDLSWSPTGGASTYNVERSPAGVGAWTVLNSGLTGTSFADTSVAQMTAYDYRLVAVGTAGRGTYSATQSVTTPQAVPAQVTGVSASTPAPTEVDLSWSTVPTATSYEIERSSTSATSGYTPLSTSVTSTSYADTTASAQTTYWYEVVAHNGGGWGSVSTYITAVTPAVNNALLSNTFDGATGNSTLTPANSGGASGNPLNQVGCASGTTAYSSASPAHGSYSALLAPTTQLCYLGWGGKSIATTTSAYGRAYLRLSADPNATIGLLKVGNSAGVRDAQVSVSSTGKLGIVDAANATQVTFSKAIPLNQWVRVEWHLVAAATGSFQVELFVGDSNTVIESELVAGINTGSSIATYQVGMLCSDARSLSATIGVDNLAYGTAGWIGPATH